MLRTPAIVLIYLLVGLSDIVFAQEIDFLPKSDNKEVIHHSYFSLSYIDKHKDAEWVAYKLEDFMTRGNARRASRFRVDPMVKDGTARHDDYTNSGFDRGHLCPAADMKWSQDAMNETFYMSNITPQNPSFNSGIWNNLEARVRQWASELKQVYVVTGPILRDSLPTIGRQVSISVPEQFYKIVLEYQQTEQKAIAFLLPNRGSSQSLEQFVVSVDSIEVLTNIDFFPALPDSIENVLESHSDPEKWGLLGKHKTD